MPARRGNPKVGFPQEGGTVIGFPRLRLTGSGRRWRAGALRSGASSPNDDWSEADGSCGESRTEDPSTSYPDRLT